MKCLSILLFVLWILSSVHHSIIHIDLIHILLNLLFHFYAANVNSIVFLVSFPPDHSQHMGKLFGKLNLYPTTLLLNYRFLSILCIFYKDNYVICKQRQFYMFIPNLHTVYFSCFIALARTSSTILRRAVERLTCLHVILVESFWFLTIKHDVCYSF